MSALFVSVETIVLGEAIVWHRGETVVVKRLLAAGVVAATGVGVAVPNALALTAATLAELAATALGVVLGIVLVAAAVLLYQSDVSTDHALRVAGWNTLGVIVLGLVLLLATRYPGVAFPLPIGASVVGVSAVAHVLIGVNDVRRIRANELAREREKLALINRLVRHNLRNQAQVLTSAGEIVAEHVTDETGREAAERIGRGAERIGAINTKLGRFQEATDYDEPAQRVDVREAVESAAEPYRDAYPDATIDVDVPTGLVAMASEKLETAIDELLENAFEHGRGAETSVAVRAATTGDWVEVTVSDGGPGISDQEWELVTGDREQSQLEHASGLGLWVVKAIVESVDGELVRGPDGTAVTIRLPSA